MPDYPSRFIEQLLSAIQHSDQSQLKSLLGNDDDLNYLIGEMNLSESEKIQQLKDIASKRARIFHHQLASFDEMCTAVDSAQIDWNEITIDAIKEKTTQQNGIANNRLNFDFGTDKWRFSVCVSSIVEIRNQWKILSGIQFSCEQLDIQNPASKSVLLGEFSLIQWSELRAKSAMANQHFYFEERYRDGKVAYAQGPVEMETMDLDTPFYGCQAIVIDGPLDVLGGISNENGNVGNLLYVAGDLKANHIIAGGCEFHVEGVCQVQDVAIAHGNDGVLILNELVTRLLVDHDHHTEIANGQGVEKHFRSDENFDQLQKFLATEPDSSDPGYPGWALTKSWYLSG